MYQRCLFAVIDPSLSGKIRWLGAVEAVVETSVITKRERHDELPGLLSDLRTTQISIRRMFYFESIHSFPLWSLSLLNHDVFLCLSVHHHLVLHVRQRRINKRLPFQMGCHIFSGWTVKLKSSCGAERLHSPGRYLERNLETQDLISSGAVGPLWLFLFKWILCKTVM